MKKQLLAVIFIAFLFLSIVLIPQISQCQTATPKTTPKSTLQPTPTTEPQQGNSLNLLIIGGIIAAIAVVGAISGFILFKKRVNEKSLSRFSSPDFQNWVIKRFNGKPADPSSGVNGFTEGGQPLLIKQSEHVSLAEVEDFVNVLAKGKAQKGTIVAFNFDKDTFDGKVAALDKGIELQMFRIYELLNKRFSDKINNIASSQGSFETPRITEDQVTERETFEKMPNELQTECLKKPLVFISHSNTKVNDQVKKMLDFLHYDYVMGDKEETTVPIPDNKFGLMKDCDCAIINISAAEQDRTYSGIYILNSNVISEINAAYLKYSMQVILLVERKVELPSNLKGLKRIEYDSDDLSFNAAMDLNKALADFKKI